MFFFLLALVWLVAADRHFMRTGINVGAVVPQPYNGPLGLDLVVNQAILVTAVGVVDVGTAGLVGNFSVVLLERSTHAVVVGPFTLNASDARNSSGTDVTAWRTIEPARVEAGTYLLTTNWTAANTYISSAANGHTVVPGDADGLVTPLSSVSTKSFPGIFQCGPNMQFRAADPLPLSPSDRQDGVFADCEDVACRVPGRSGLFNIRGRLRFCDNESQGGGWTRLWSADESSCEANGWTSTRISLLQEAPGCRNDVLPCKAATTALASTPFRAVLVRDFELWTIGNTGTTVASSSSFDGVAVHADATLVWAFLASSQCPCVTNTSEAASSKLGGAHWSCDTGQRDTATWQPLFGGGANVCSGANETVRVLAEPRVSLKISICQDAAGPAKGIKLAKGVIFVRKNARFRRTLLPRTGYVAAHVEIMAADDHHNGSDDGGGTNGLLADRCATRNERRCVDRADGHRRVLIAGRPGARVRAAATPGLETGSVDRDALGARGRRRSVQQRRRCPRAAKRRIIRRVLIVLEQHELAICRA